MILNDLIAKCGPLLSVAPSATVREAADKMVAANVGCTLVLASEKLVGILTERDLVRRVLVKGLDGDEVYVRDVMTRDVVIGKAKDQVELAVRLMTVHHIRHLPVVDRGGSVVGVLSIRNLLREEIQGMRDYIGQSEG